MKKFTPLPYWNDMWECELADKMNRTYKLLRFEIWEGPKS